MKKGYSRDTRLLTKYLDQDTKDQIDLLLMEASISTNQTPDFTEDIEEFYKEITHVDIEDIRRYTGYDYKFINAVLRDNWNYDENGLKTENKTKEFRDLSNRISNLMSKNIISLEMVKEYLQQNI